MRFEEGKFYGFKGTAQMVMFIAGAIHTMAEGSCYCGEVVIRGSLPALRPVGKKEKNAEGWEEITREMYLDTAAHWVDEFADVHSKKAEVAKQSEEMGIQTAFRQLSAIIEHPQRKTKTLFLMCGHSIVLVPKEWDAIPDDKKPKKGEMMFCATCDIQNRAMAQNMMIDGKPGIVAKVEDGNASESADQVCVQSSGKTVPFPGTPAI